ncbi:MAG: hypothetical protein HOO96_35320 [Polyangiaceae bacterium]|nr:hypothetical protein [Polyangiaceae bacterium]
MTRPSSYAHTAVLALVASIAASGCASSEASDATPSTDDNYTAAPGYSTVEYEASFSPAVLRSNSAQTIKRGVSRRLVGVGPKGACEVYREDAWQMFDLVIPADERFYFEGKHVKFIKFSDGKLGVRAHLLAYPNDAHYVPLVLSCWNNRGDMPTASDVAAALTRGHYELGLTFTPSGAPAPSKDAGADAR